MTQGAQRLRRGDEGDVRRFLARNPYENVLLEWLLDHERSPASRSRFFFVPDDRGEVAGVAHFGRQAVVVAQSEAAVDALANAAVAYRDNRLIVLPRRIAKRYWERISGWHAPPRFTRERQPLLAVDASTLIAFPNSRLTVRRAEPTELRAIVQNSAEMIEHELGYDPRRGASDFTWNVRRMIERGWWWVGFIDRAPVFYCHLGPYSEATAQLQGVWTPPQIRGRNIATVALSSICAELLQEFPTISLYVNDFNIEALRVYEKVGFTEVGELTTFLF